MERAIRAVRSIEVSSRCNLACRYCLHPIMARPKLDMTDDVWAATLRHVAHFVRRGTQGELNLSLVGESTLHPALPRFCLEARAVLGADRVLRFTTNGKGVTATLVRALVPSGVRVTVTNHHAHLAGPTAYLLHQYGLLEDVSHDPVSGAQTWAGQVDWYDVPGDAGRPVCMMLDEGLGTVLADGRVVICCMDGTGETTRGHVTDAPGTWAPLRPWHRCALCWQQPPAR